jgi:hypothetical protein
MVERTVSVCLSNLFADGGVVVGTWSQGELGKGNGRGERERGSEVDGAVDLLTYGTACFQ